MLISYRKRSEKSFKYNLILARYLISCNKNKMNKKELKMNCKVNYKLEYKQTVNLTQVLLQANKIIKTNPKTMIKYLKIAVS